MPRRLGSLQTRLLDMTLHHRDVVGDSAERLSDKLELVPRERLPRGTQLVATFGKHRDELGGVANI